MNIHIQGSTAGLIDEEVRAQVDEDASLTAYLSTVEEGLREEFPQAQITCEIITSWGPENTGISITGVDEDREIAAIQQAEEVCSSIYGNSHLWIVERAA